ncbi:hypothetical protein E8E12_008140 [Didymella heteroderae]|uniref:FAD-binding FR-type domain-containing protein n=1 Tax=Didymella heteroderae TaxID=1769908 RepID=A0A9P4WZC6_9PLEO|nr:hypothetical protein E8E12_008140 [Didymella heteroderae]
MSLSKLRFALFLSPLSSPAYSPGLPKMIPVPSSILRPTCLKVFAGTVVFILILQVVSLARPSLPQTERLHSISNSMSVAFPRPRPLPFPQFNSYGSTQCLPPISPDLLKKSVEKHATCSKYSPFHPPRTRIATLTAQFGGIEGNEHYIRAFATHLEHALVHGTEVHVLCDKMIDDLWNKPAFILDLLLREMIKPEKERLEWFVWVDRDTLILDQCRPASTFLPSSTSSTHIAKWWRRDDQHSEDAKNNDNNNRPPPEVHLLAANDPNGLNNGIFLLRVSHWAVEMFTAILAFRHYNPKVELKFTEQSAMELVIQDKRFKDRVQLVPQHWFNAYQHGGAEEFVSSNGTNPEGWDELNARRGDWLIHFAGNQHKDEVLNEWADMVEGMKDVWETGKVQRNVDGETLEPQQSEQVNHNTKLLRFKLPKEDYVSGLSWTSAILTASWPKGSWTPVARPYTPISSIDEPGKLELLVKHYPGGKQSTHLHSLKPGDSLLFAAALRSHRWEPNSVPHVTLIAGGCGVTPIYQLARGILSDPEDKTKITLVYGANTEEDILLKNELDDIQKEFPGRFETLYAISQPAKGSTIRKGRVSKELLAEVARPNDGKVFMCGPPAMEAALKGDRNTKGILEELGYKKDQIHSF